MSGRPVLAVTGGGRGIGAAIVVAAAGAGYDIALNYRADHARAEQTAQLARARGARVEMMAGDMAKQAAIEEFFSSIDERFGQLDGLVNNAGVLDRPMLVHETDPAQLDQILALNIGGYVLCLREAGRRMKAQGSGCVINISSRLAELGGAGGFTVYAATKGAIETLTRGAGRELAPYGVRVNAVSPGVIDTEIHAAAGQPDRLETLRGQIPAQRVGTPDEVADVVMWLLSDQATYVTGAVIPVSGGR